MMLQSDCFWQTPVEKVRGSPPSAGYNKPCRNVHHNKPPGDFDAAQERKKERRRKRDGRRQRKR